MLYVLRMYRLCGLCWGGKGRSVYKLLSVSEKAAIYAFTRVSQSQTSAPFVLFLSSHSQNNAQGTAYHKLW